MNSSELSFDMPHLNAPLGSGEKSATLSHGLNLSFMEMH